MFNRNHNTPDKSGNNATQSLSQTIDKMKAWAKTHKPQTIATGAGIALILCLTVAGIAWSAGAFEKTPTSAEPTAKDEAKAETADLALNVTADAGWDENSTPAIAHIVGKDSNVDFYHAVSPDAEGNKGASTVTLEEGDYTVSFVSPVNADGSAYEIYDTGKPVDVTVDADAEKAPSVDCPMTQIPADQVTDDMLQDIVDQTKDAVENGDETLKGDAGKDILDKLEGNVANNPNASDETKQEATDADKEVDVNGQPEATTPSGDNGNTSDKGNANNNGGSNAGNSGSNDNGSGTSSKPSGDSSSQPSAPAHSHSWKDHTATKQVWVPNIVTVTDYADQQVAVGTRYIFAEDGFVTTDSGTAKAHAVELVRQGYAGNYRMETIYETQRVPVGSHTEDHGHYETQTYVDYQYCDCGATR